MKNLLALLSFCILFSTACEVIERNTDIQKLTLSGEQQDLVR